MKKKNKSTIKRNIAIGSSVLLLFLFLTAVAASVYQIKIANLDSRSKASGSNALYPVTDLPTDNLIVNPWFGDTSCQYPSFQGWTSDPNNPDHKWTASDKPTNPSPPNGCITSGRISVGEEGANSATVQPNQEVKMYQIVEANPENKNLVFDMYWVVHTINSSFVNVYGGNSANGPWTKIWTPFSYSKQTQLVPPSGTTNSVVWLWKCYSDHYTECSDAPQLPATKTLTQGYSYYKIEFTASLPPITGGYKQTGIYFTAKGTAPNPSPSIVPPNPTASPNPGSEIKPRASLPPVNNTHTPAPRTQGR